MFWKHGLYVITVDIRFHSWFGDYFGIRRKFVTFFSDVFGNTCFAVDG